MPRVSNDVDLFFPCFSHALDVISVIVVVLTVAPLKIFNSVVAFVLVFVIYLRQIIGVRYEMLLLPSGEPTCISFFHLYIE